VYFKFIWSGREAVADRPENDGLDEAVTNLEGSSTSGHSLVTIDASDMTEPERFAIYSSEAVSATRNRYKIARSFGGRQHNAQDFGRGVPALIVYEREGDLRGTDVFPHELKDSRIVTIADGVARLGLG
jgi:hypothetical protein